MSLWTTKVVCHFIYTRFGVEYCRERGRQVLHALGFRLRRPRHRHLKAKPEEQAAFRAELEEQLTAWPEEWEVLCVDEATVRRHSTLTAQWYLAEAVPEVPTGDDHTKVHVYGAVVPLTGPTHHQISPKLGKEDFARFLRRLLRCYRAKRLNVGEVSNGDEVVGLTRAFIFAGAPSVIATLWSVNDRATGLLMERFYTLLQSGVRKAEALQKAQQAVREVYPHPYYWGAFVLTGDGGNVTAKPGSREPPRAAQP